MKNVNSRLTIFMASAVVMIFLSGCSQERNPFQKQQTNCAASECHKSTLLKQSLPLSGKHQRHINRGFICENCHDNYITDINHKNGALDSSSSVNLVFFDLLNPGARWDNPTGDCSNLTCHGAGSSAINWYADFSGDCAACHSSGSAIDPLNTGGAGVKGKHNIHVTGRSIKCGVCHENYYDTTTHMNGVYGKLETASIVSFDSDGSTGWPSPGNAVTAVYDDSTGVCGSISCHGGSGGVTWYASASGCASCHAPGSAIDPMTSSGSGTDGKHAAHVVNKSIECEVCHENYKSNGNHMNGTYGKLETLTIMSFDTDGSQGSAWGNVAVNFTDSNGMCDNISCHANRGGITWYTAGTGCAACHATGTTIDPVTTSGSGINGKHIAHVSNMNIQCEVCHEAYKLSPNHMNNIYGKVETDSIVNFDSDGSQGSAWGEVTVTGFDDSTGMCGNISCHKGTGGITWYETGGCTQLCHKMTMNARRQVTGPGGDFEKESHHVINYGARSTEIVAENDCRVCHDMASHMGGTVRLKDKDNPGQSIVYTTPASLEPFCLSCHDTDGALAEAVPMKPFNALDPNTLGIIPNGAGVLIKDYWNRQFGHRRKGLTCMGDGSSGTGCHGDMSTGKINAHGSSNRGMLVNKMTFPTPNSYDASGFKLCNDCHAGHNVPLSDDIVATADYSNYGMDHPIYGYEGMVTSGPWMTTKFHDYQAGNGYVFNLHSLHLTSNNWWYYRGEAVRSPASCVSCHNVHGSAGADNQILVQQVAFSFVYDNFNPTIVDSSGVEKASMWDINTTTTAPQYCSTASCHATFYPRKIFNEAYAVASGNGNGILENGEQVIIRFSGSTNGSSLTIDEANINTLLNVCSTMSGMMNTLRFVCTGDFKDWTDIDKSDNPTGSLIVTWSSSDGIKIDNVLTITFFVSANGLGNPTVQTDDYLVLRERPGYGTPSGINDLTNGLPYPGRVQIKGSF